MKFGNIISATKTSKSTAISIGKLLGINTSLPTLHEVKHWEIQHEDQDPIRFSSEREAIAKAEQLLKGSHYGAAFVDVLEFTELRYATEELMNERKVTGKEFSLSNTIRVKKALRMS